VTRFKDAWEKFESDKLILDRDTRIECAKVDKEWSSENLEKVKDDEDKFVEEQMNLLEIEPVDDDEKLLFSNKFRLQF